MGMLRLRQVLLYWNGQIFWKYGHTWIALWRFTKIPISVVTINFDSSFFPCFLSNFSLINTKDIRFIFFKIIFQIFFIENWSDSIDIPWGNKKFVWGFSCSIFPICLVGFAMGNTWTIIKLFGAGLGHRLFIFKNLISEEFRLFFFFLFWLRWRFLMIFFRRHFSIIINEIFVL